MIAIIDYGVGNLFSLSSSLRAVGAGVVVTDDREILKKADRLILPGVGAFADAAAKLRAGGLDGFVREQAASGKPLLGICLACSFYLKKAMNSGTSRSGADSGRDRADAGYDTGRPEDPADRLEPACGSKAKARCFSISKMETMSISYIPTMQAAATHM